MRPYIINEKSTRTTQLLYDIFTSFWTMTGITFGFLPFVCLTIEDTLKGFRAMNYTFIIFTFLAYLISISVPRKKAEIKEEKQE